MANWQHEVNVVAEWKAFDTDVVEVALPNLINKLKEHSLYTTGSTYKILVDALATSEDIPDFDHNWHHFYNFCDEHKIWVKTNPFI